MESILAERTETDQKHLDISSEMDAFEGYNSPHAMRLAFIACGLADALNLASHDRDALEQAALIHDIGEMKMAREYIALSRRLSVNERIDLERHPVIGEQEAARLGHPRSVQLLVRWHHEWWCGSGYPDRIEGEQIPLAARILRVADTYCAMTAARPYRRPFSDEDARNHLKEWAGIEFDPAIVKTFLAGKFDEPVRPTTGYPDPFEDGLEII